MPTKTALNTAPSKTAYRQCSKCQLREPIARFASTLKSPKSKKVKCLGCKTKEQRIKNWKDQKINIRYKDYLFLGEAQLWACKICKVSFGSWAKKSGPQLAVDHDHENPKVIRGLLCVNCNTGLGKFKDDTALLSAAIAYLERNARSPTLLVR